MTIFSSFLSVNPMSVFTYHSYWAALHTLRYCHVPPPSVTHFDLRGQIHPHARCYPRKSIQNIRILRITYHLNNYFFLFRGLKVYNWSDRKVGLISEIFLSVLINALRPSWSNTSTRPLLSKKIYSEYKNITHYLSS